MSVIHVNENNINALMKENRPILIDFYAEWCGPCRMVGPIIEKIAAENGDIAVAKVNVENEQALARRFGIASIPTLVVIKDGEVVNRSVGAQPERKILELIGKS